MTIPVVPGPFSFLQTAGESLGTVGALRHQRYLEEMAKARQAIMDAVMMRQQFHDPSVMQGPGVQDAAQRLGYSLPTTPTAEDQRNEMIAGILGRYQNNAPPLVFDLPSFVSDFAPPQRITAPVPGSRAGISDEELRVAGLPSRSSVIEEGNAQVAARANTPGIAPTIVAGQEHTRQPAVDDATDEVVLSLYSTLGRLPTVSEAFTHGQKNVRVQRLGDSLTRDSYGAAIARLKQLQDQLGVAQLRARAAAAGAGAGAADDLLTRITAQESALQREYDAMFIAPGILLNPNDQAKADDLLRQIQAKQQEWDNEYRRHRPGALPPNPLVRTTPPPSESSGRGPVRGTVPASTPKAQATAEYNREVQANPARYGSSANLTDAQKANRDALIRSLSRQYGISLTSQAQ